MSVNIPNIAEQLLEIVPTLREEYPYLDTSGSGICESHRFCTLPAHIEETICCTLAFKQNTQIFLIALQIIDELQTTSRTPDVQFIAGLLLRMLVFRKADGSETIYIRERADRRYHVRHWSDAQLIGLLKSQVHYGHVKASTIPVVKWFLDTEGMCPHLPPFDVEFEAYPLIHAKPHVLETFNEKSIRLGHNYGALKKHAITFLELYIRDIFRTSHPLYHCITNLIVFGSDVTLKSMLDDIVCNKTPQNVDFISGYGTRTRVTDVFYNLPSSLPEEDHNPFVLYGKKQRPLSNKLCIEGEKHLWKLHQDSVCLLSELGEYANKHRAHFSKFGTKSNIKELQKRFSKNLKQKQNILTKLYEYCKRIPYAIQLSQIDARFPSVTMVLNSFPDFEELRQAVAHHPSNMDASEMLSA